MPFLDPLQFKRAKISGLRSKQKYFLLKSSLSECAARLRTTDLIK